MTPNEEALTLKFTQQQAVMLVRIFRALIALIVVVAGFVVTDFFWKQDIEFQMRLGTADRHTSTQAKAVEHLRGERNEGYKPITDAEFDDIQNRDHKRLSRLRDGGNQ